MILIHANVDLEHLMTTTIRYSFNWKHILRTLIVVKQVHMKDLGTKLLFLFVCKVAAAVTPRATGHDNFMFCNLNVLVYVFWNTVCKSAFPHVAVHGFILLYLDIELFSPGTRSGNSCLLLCEVSWFKCQIWYLMLVDELCCIKLYCVMH